MARVYLVGTDTGVGKTTVACALLRAARRRGVSVLPFKPAQTGDDHPSDAERLADAAGLPPARVPEIRPLTWSAPVAPGIADDPIPFLTRRLFDAPCPALDRVALALHTLEQQTSPALVLLEGAGGLHVPMPGGSWQPRWVVALATHTLVVGRAGLGTIHHTLAVIEGLRAVGRPPLGFVLSAAAPPDPSVQTNAQVIATASGVPHVATFAADEPGRAAAADATLDTLRRVGALDP